MPSNLENHTVDSSARVSKEETYSQSNDEQHHLGLSKTVTSEKRRFGQRRHVAGSDQVEHYFTDVRTGLIVSLFNVGCAFGCLVLAKAMDLYGRKLAIAGAAVIYIVGILIQICSFKKFYQVFIGRLITGSAVGLLSVVCVAFIGELSPPDIRSLTVALYQLMVTFGIFLGYLINFGTNKNYKLRSMENPIGIVFPMGSYVDWCLVLRS